MKEFTLGSLFDGSGGFPLAGSLCGIEPKWAAEVEPYPIAVTRSRFPNMKHLGSVTDIHGGEIEPVDIITFGSPCQDLSVAGKRAGLKHEANGDEETTRSGLFMEAVRIIKEMREATNGAYPSFALWENVPGAFSSNKGEDFRTVLEELVRIVEPNATMPSVPKAGWAYADSYRGDGWSLAYRVFDAQYWGVPQRRRRIHLVLDLRGERAGKVLFEREGVRGYFEACGAQRQGTAANPERGAGTDDRKGSLLEPRSMKEENWSEQSAKNALRAGESKSSHAVCVPVGLDLYNFAVSGDTAVTLNANSGQSANHAGPTVCVPYTLKIRSRCEGGGKGALIQTDKSATLATNNDQYLFQPVPDILLDDQGGQQIGVRTDGKSPTLRAEMHGNVPAVVEAYSFDSLASNSMKSSNPHSGCRRVEVAKTLDTTDPNPSKNQGGIAVVEPTAIFNEAYQHHGWRETDTAGTLTAGQNGTVRGDTPLVCVPAMCKTFDARGNGDGETVSTLTGDHENRITDYTSVVCELKVYTKQAIGAFKDCGKASTLAARDYKDATDLVCGVDCRNLTESPELYQTLQAKPNGGQSLNYSGAARVRYIVRRLTPTECARLQGFADHWGHPDTKDDFTDEEYNFWLNVRNTHAAINGKAVKEYTKEQMLAWYGKLHTDSAEYKMWGNGIALPPALYCMQGIAKALFA